MWQDEICQRCYTTHPLNSAGVRECPKPPIELHDDPNRKYSTVVLWNTSGATRGYSGGGKIPKTPTINAGHTQPTLNSLGLTAEDGLTLGI